MFVLRRQCRGSSVYLLEMSLDCSLAHAALRLEVRDGSTILPDMSVQELECSSVAVLFATSSSVFRLLLPHPDAISKVHVDIHMYISLVPRPFSACVQLLRVATFENERRESLVGKIS